MHLPAYPTVAHERAARAVVRFFSRAPIVDAVVLTGSCARGLATADSCVDMAVLVDPAADAAALEALAAEWVAYRDEADVFRALRHAGRFAQVDLDLFDGQFEPGPRDWTSGPDSFELEIGNTLVYSGALWERGDGLRALRGRWLPYYDEGLRGRRLREVSTYCRNNLDHIPLYAARGLHVQSFKRLFDAFREFLQALFIAQRMYPISYEKWVKEQVDDMLARPDLYSELAAILALERLDGGHLVDRSERLRALLEVEVLERIQGLTAGEGGRE